MPHQRSRHILALLEKRLKLFSVVGILGARQTGKSTLLRELLPALRKTVYVTLDRDEIKNLALKQPTLFLQNLEEPSVKTVCIDEVQKAPVLFDTIKAEVDEKKRPGRFAISGSTEFSKKTGIQDSLTGRISLLRMFSLNLSEITDSAPAYALTNPEKNLSKKNSIKLRDVQMWLERGGMPGMFSVRDQNSREALFESWLETTCTRDLAQFNIPRFNPDLARRILLTIANVRTPNRTEIAREVGKTPRQIENYFQAFKALFVIYEIEPYKTSVGKPLFYLFDAGIAAFAGADINRRLQIWFLNECLSQFSYSGTMRPDLFYYESSRGSRMDFIVESKNIKYAVQLCHQEAPDSYTLRTAEAFLLKHPEIPVYVAAPCLEIHRLKSVLKIVPWSLITV